MAEETQQIPISQLPAATTFSGLVTIGTENTATGKRSVKIPLAAVISAPRIGDNGNWWIYSFAAGGYVDSGSSARGATGQSAYDYAVEVLHFDGTIAEWYESMKGAALTFDDLTPTQKEALRGKPGDDGVGIVRTDIMYCVTDNQEVDVRTLEWTDTMPSLPVGKWLWTKVMLYYSDTTNYAFYTKTQRSASAYEMAVAGGYTGTEQQFMALLVSVANNTSVWLTEEEFNALPEYNPNVEYNIYEEVDSL